MSHKAKQFITSPLFIAAAALALRLMVLWWTWHHAPLGARSEPYGFEAGRIAESIASGRGFSSPLLLVRTGATAYLCPLYPYILALIFKIFGIYTFRSEVVAQLLNCIFVSLIVFPIFAIAKTSFGANVPWFASWLWAILPNAWHVPIVYIWDTSLAALILAGLFWFTIHLRGKNRPILWIGYAFLWAVGVLLNASVAALLPFFLLWLIRTQRKSSLPAVALFSLVFVLGLSPWTLRNYRVFGKLIPIRSTFGLMLWCGNNAQAVGNDSFAFSLVWNRSEADKFKEMGELPYMQREQAIALAYIRSHPAQTLKNLAGRIFSNWFAVTDRPNDHILSDPLYVKALFAFNATFVLLAWLGAFVAWRSQNQYSILFLTVMLVYPLVYYLTVTLVRYRFPIDPIMTILVGYCGACIVARRIPNTVGDAKNGESYDC